jgi:hypothetical protein
MGRYANLYLVMVQDPGDSTVYQPIIATDRGLWVEKDIQAYGALFTSSDPGKGTGGGAVLIGHGFYGNQNFPPCIVLPDSGFNTLHLYSSVVTEALANMKLDILFANHIRLSSTMLPTIAPTWNGSGWVNGVGLGSTNYFWNYIDSAYYFAKYTSFLSFDALDDLGLVKTSKVKKIGDINVVDMDSLPHLKADDPSRPDSVDMGKVHGFLIGCAKQTALKLEEIEDKIASVLKLQEEVTELRGLVNKLNSH